MNKVRVYTSESSIRKPTTFFGDMWDDMLHARALAWRLAVRDISALYRQSFLGILWAFILPLANTVTWLFLRNTGIVSVRETDIPYPVYVFTGTMLWAIVTESLLAPLQKTQSSISMLTKINFPREAIILSGIYQAAFNAGIKILLMFLGMIVLGYYSIDWSILFFPVGIISLILVGTSIGLILTPIGMLYTDISKGLSVVMQFLMYVTPVVFPIPTAGWVSSLIALNPLTPLIMTTRDWVTGHPTQFLPGFILVTVMFVATCFFAWILYRVAMPFLIERMSS